VRQAHKAGLGGARHAGVGRRWQDGRMATPREARRAIARGDPDGALVLLWNAIEPLRLRGDRDGLEQVQSLAALVAERGDEAHAHEAERLSREVEEVLGADAASVASAPVAAVAGPVEEAAQIEWDEVAGTLDEAPVAPEASPSAEGDAPEETGGRRLGPLIWAAFIALVIVLNVIGGLRGE
jgi:hypothetical protein